MFASSLSQPSSLSEVTANVSVYQLVSHWVTAAQGAWKEFTSSRKAGTQLPPAEAWFDLVNSDSEEEDGDQVGHETKESSLPRSSCLGFHVLLTGEPGSGRRGLVTYMLRQLTGQDSLTDGRTEVWTRKLPGVSGKQSMKLRSGPGWMEVSLPDAARHIREWASVLIDKACERAFHPQALTLVLRDVDLLSLEVQKALHAELERLARRPCSVILVATDALKVTSPLRSRCVRLHLRRPDFEQHMVPRVVELLTKLKLVDDTGGGTTDIGKKTEDCTNDTGAVVGDWKDLVVQTPWDWELIHWSARQGWMCMWVAVEAQLLRGPAPFDYNLKRPVETAWTTFWKVLNDMVTSQDPWHGPELRSLIQASKRVFEVGHGRRMPLSEMLEQLVDWAVDLRLRKAGQSSGGGGVELDHEVQYYLEELHRHETQLLRAGELKGRPDLHWLAVCLLSTQFARGVSIRALSADARMDLTLHTPWLKACVKEKEMGL